SSLEGFGKFRNIDAQFVELQSRSTDEQNEIFAQIERLQVRTSKVIQIVTLIAILTALAVAIATFREVNRRFKQTLESFEQARKERQFSSQILEGMVSAVAALDVNSRILSANQAFSRIYPEAVDGASLIEVRKKYTDESGRLLEFTLSRPTTDSVYHGRFMLSVNQAHERRAVDVYSSPLTLDEGSGRILTLVDATEAADKEAELRRKESLVAVGQATAQVAHEIRNPLGSIRLGVAMLRDTVDDAETLKTISLVERGINHLHKLTSDVTQFSRQRSLTLTNVNLQELFKESIEMVEEKIVEKNLQLRTEFSDSQIIGKWDEEAIHQVLLNLLLNAIDACDKGNSIVISTSTVNGQDGRSISSHEVAAEISKSAGEARIQIKDFGHGMDEETKKRIFEPFYTTKKKGTGLGLAIVKKIIDQHGGSISVESKPNEGTCFYIDLPMNAVGAK
ncbi:MAG: two-component system sensor histidine kinase NtrB, partial [Pyrinomonadaceae bacterium]